MTHVEPKPPRGVLALLRQLTEPVASATRLWSLVEQGSVSAANFLAMVGLARGFSEDAFGVYSYAYIALMFLMNLHRAVVVIPFVVHTATKDALAGEGRQWRRLNQWVTLACVATALVAAGGMVLVGAAVWLAEASAVVAVFVPAAFAYEFLRRWVIQQGAVRRVAAAAMLYGAIYCGCVVAAMITGELALAVAGFVLANAAAALLCLRVVGRSPACGPFRPFFARLWPYLSWSLASNVAFNLYTHAQPLILGAFAGPVPVAAYQAFRTLTQPAVVIATAIDNFDKPRAARALAAHGPAGMRRQLARTAGSMALLAAPLVGLLVVMPGTLELLVYHGRYADWLWLSYAWAAQVSLGIVAYPVETGLFVVRRPDRLCQGRFAAAAVSVGMAFALVPYFGLAGTMAALLSGWVVSVCIGMVFLRQVSHESS